MLFYDVSLDKKGNVLVLRYVAHSPATFSLKYLKELTVLCGRID